MGDILFHYLNSLTRTRGLLECVVSKAVQGNTAGTGFVLNPGEPGDPEPVRLSTPGSFLHWLLCFLISLVPLCHSVSGPVLGWGLSPNYQYPLHSSSGFITELNTHSCSTQVDPSRCSVSLNDLCPFIQSCKAPCPDQDTKSYHSLPSRQL